MNSIFTRTLKALCSVMVAAMLSACGASSTVDPFQPTRVIGLGDGYNDVGSDLSGNAPFTVTGTGEIATVVEQVAALFGVGSHGTFVTTGTYSQLPALGVFSYAVGGALINSGADSLAAQISRLSDDIGGTFNASDLIVIAAGTQNIKAAYSIAGAEAAAVLLEDQVKTLLRMGARHILILQPLELSVTPYAVRNSISVNVTSSPTVKFNAKVSGDLNDYVSRQGLSGNSVIYGAGTSSGNFSSIFNTYAQTTPYAEFTTSTQIPYCPSPQLMTGCQQTLNDPTVYDTTLFADDLNLTPYGNRWVGGFLYAATAQGWR
jgi:phospholipase/lecithinase/hemolysin